MPNIKTPGPLSALIRDEGVKALLKELEALDSKIMPVFLVNAPNYPGAIFPHGGKLEDNRDVTVLGNNAAGSRTITVPVGKRWFLVAVYVHNGDNVSRNIDVDVWNASDQRIHSMMRTQAVGAGEFVSTPPGGVTGRGGSVPLEAGWYIKISWAAGGSSAGGNAESAAIILEVDE